MEDPDDVAHDAERDAGLGEARALLDVELEVGHDLGRGALRHPRFAGLAERAQRIGDRDPRAVRSLGSAIRQPAERGARAEQADPEARPLLVAPAHDLHRSREAQPVIEERLDRLDRAEHPERAVESSALRHRVQMRADEHARTIPAEAAVEICRRVAAWYDGNATDRETIDAQRDADGLGADGIGGRSRDGGDFGDRRRLRQGLL